MISNEVLYWHQCHFQGSVIGAGIIIFKPYSALIYNTGLQTIKSIKLLRIITLTNTLNIFHPLCLGHTQLQEWRAPLLEACTVLHYSVYLPSGCSLTHGPAAVLTDERPLSVTPGHNMSAQRL